MSHSSQISRNMQLHDLLAFPLLVIQIQVFAVLHTRRGWKWYESLDVFLNLLQAFYTISANIDLKLFFKFKNFTFSNSFAVYIWISEIPLIISDKYSTNYNQHTYANQSVKFNLFICVHTLNVFSGILIADNEGDSLIQI